MSLFAVIKTGGKQYLVEKGDILRIEKIEEKVGKKILFKEILLCFDDKKKKVEIGKPHLKIQVEAEVLAQDKAKKIKIIKYKPKTRYHRTQGHRQPYTEIKILSIGLEKKSVVSSKKPTTIKKTEK